MATRFLDQSWFTGNRVEASVETHERGLGALIGLLAVASLCIGAGEAHAQSVFFVRLAPEVGRITVEHTKEVTIQGGSSSSTSSSSGLALAGNLSVGLLLELPGAGSWAARSKVPSPADASLRARFLRPRTGTFTMSGPASGTSVTCTGRVATSSSARATGRPLAGLRLRWNPSNVDRVRFRIDESRDRNGQ